jgi:hypothetical protein
MAADRRAAEEDFAVSGEWRNDLPGIALIGVALLWSEYGLI